MKGSDVWERCGGGHGAVMEDVMRPTNAEVCFDVASSGLFSLVGKTAHPPTCLTGWPPARALIDQSAKVSLSIHSVVRPLTQPSHPHHA